MIQMPITNLEVEWSWFGVQQFVILSGLSLSKNSWNRYVYFCLVGFASIMSIFESKWNIYIRYVKLPWPLSLNKTRGLRRCPTRETIVLRCYKFNPESTEIFEFEVKNSELFGTGVARSQECFHKNSKRYFIQNWRYP